MALCLRRLRPAGARPRLGARELGAVLSFSVRCCHAARRRCHSGTRALKMRSYCERTRESVGDEHDAGIPVRPQREHPRPRRASARGERRHAAVRRRAGAPRRHCHNQAGRDPRDHRPERSGQDEPAQLRQRPVPTAAGLDSAAQRHRPRADAGTAEPDRPLGRRALVPEHRALPPHDGGREPPPRPPRAHEALGGTLAPLLRAGAAPGDQRARARRGGDRLPRVAARRARACSRSGRTGIPALHSSSTDSLVRSEYDRIFKGRAPNDKPVSARRGRPGRMRRHQGWT